MSSSTPPKKASVEERIIATACDLFYRQGYRATGINQIISESGVAKASFYDHFPSKEDLLYAYARETSKFELDEVRTDVMAKKTPRERFFQPLHLLTPWFEESDYRGCPFQLLVSEAPPEAERVFEVSRQHREEVRELFRELGRDLVADDPSLAGMDIEAVADIYVVLFEGTIASAVAFRETWPVTRAVEALEMVLGRYRT